MDDQNQPEIHIDPCRLFGRLDQLVDLKETIEMKGLPLGGYIRVSTSKEAQKTSLENQEKFLREWAEVNGYKLYRIYTDVKSGQFSHLRHELQELLADVREGKVKGVLTKEIARSSRDVMDTLELKRTLADHGAFLISIRENYDCRTDDDEFLLILHAALAQKERKTTSSRVKVTQILKSKEGKGNVPPPYGYQYGPDKHYIPHPEEAPVLKEIVHLFLYKGWGREKISKHLNRKNLPAPRGGKWRSSTIRIILTNPAYTGTMVYNTTTLIRTATGIPKRVIRPRDEWVIVPHAHEPLVTVREFQAIQELIQARREGDARKSKSFKRKYLLSGLLFCGVCGGRVYGSRFTQKWGGEREKEWSYFRYICHGKNGRCGPKMKYWHMDRVDQAVLEKLQEHVRRLVHPDEILKFVEERKDLFTDDLYIERQKREQLQQQLEKTEKAMKKQQIAYEEEVINLEEFKARMAELRQKRDSLQEQLLRLNQKLSKLDTAQDTLCRLSELMIKLIEHLDSLDEERKRELAELLIARVELFQDYEFKITWVNDAEDI